MPHQIAVAAATIFGGSTLAGGVAAYSAGYAVGTFLVSTASSLALSTAISMISAPGQPDRQASVLQLTLGEAPREAIFGRMVTGGTLMDAGNYGGIANTKYEILVIAVADHLCDGIEGYYVGEDYYEWTGNGAQPDFVGPHGGDNLWLYWRDGSEVQYPPAEEGPALGHPSGTPFGAGVAHLWVRYMFNEKVWPAGRPRFRFKVRGLRLYDMRLDSTVAGGSGPQRWANPATHVWSENAALAEYYYRRGVYACGRQGQAAQLLVGRGLSADDAPPERVIAHANICDEAVALKAGGTEPRYRVGGVIRANEAFITVAENFALAMGGQVIKRDGGMEVEPGYAKAVPADLEFTDKDISPGKPIIWNEFQSALRRRTTYVPRYIEPTMGWADHAAPVRRDTDDIAADGRPEEETLPLVLVTSGTQAQRCAEIRRRLARLEVNGVVPLSAPYACAEDGDWTGYTSARRLGGARKVFRVENFHLGQDYVNTVTLREISAQVYAWNAAVDEHTPLSAPAEPLEVNPLELEDVAAEPASIGVTGGGQVPAIRVEWDADAVDPAIKGIEVQVRNVVDGVPADQVVVSNVPQASLFDGAALVAAGVVGQATMQVRLIPLGSPEREVVASPWIDVTTTALVSDDTAFLDGLLASAMAASIERLKTDTARLSQATITETYDRIAQNETVRALLHNPDGESVQAFAAREVASLKTGVGGLAYYDEVLGVMSGPLGAESILLNGARVEVPGDGGDPVAIGALTTDLYTRVKQNAAAFTMSLSLIASLTASQAVSVQTLAAQTFAADAAHTASIAVVASDLGAEVSTRTAQVATLTTNLATEASTRGAADTTLSAGISSEATTRAGADTALGADITTLFSTTAGQASTLSAVAADITTLYATTGSHTASISTHAAAIADTDGRLAGQWGVNIDLDGTFSYLKLMTSGGGGATFSKFVVGASAFEVWVPGLTSSLPMFSVDSTGAYVAGDRVVTESVAANNITYPVALTGSPSLTGTGISNWHLIASGNVPLNRAGQIHLSVTGLQRDTAAGSFKYEFRVNGVAVGTPADSNKVMDIVSVTALANGAAGNNTVELYWAANAAQRLDSYTLTGVGLQG